MSDALGDGYTTEVHEAWAAVWDIVKTTMIGKNYDYMDATTVVGLNWLRNVVPPRHQRLPSCGCTYQDEPWTITYLGYAHCRRPGLARGLARRRGGLGVDTRRLAGNGTRLR